jgi:hypothetical protein
VVLPVVVLPVLPVAPRPVLADDPVVVEPKMPLLVRDWPNAGAETNTASNPAATGNNVERMAAPVIRIPGKSTMIVSTPGEPWLTLPAVVPAARSRQYLGTAGEN